MGNVAHKTIGENAATIAQSNVLDLPEDLAALEAADAKYTTIQALLTDADPAIVTSAYAASYNGSKFGGGMFEWDATALKSTADGGHIFDPLRAATITGQTTGTDTGTGCWIRRADYYSETQFGAVPVIAAPAESVDHSTYINAAADAAQLAHGALQLCEQGELQIKQTVNLRGLNFQQFGRIYAYTTSNIPIITGGLGSYNSLDQTLTSIVSRGAYVGPIVRVIGLVKSKLHVGRCAYLQLYASRDAAEDERVTGCKFTGGYCEKIEIVDEPSPVEETGLQWINENIFQIQATDIVIQGNKYVHNHNYFHKPLLEAGTITLNSAWDNIFYDIRGEAGLTVHFGEGRLTYASDLPSTHRNMVHVPWRGSNSHRDISTLVTVTGADYLNGVFYGETALEKVELVDINADTALVLDNATGLSVTGNDVTSAAWTYFYETPFIPAGAQGLFFVLEMEGDTGGFRPELIAYDASQVVLPASAEVKDLLATGIAVAKYGDSLSSVNTTRLLRIEPLTEAAFFKIKLRAGGTGAVFEHMRIEAVSYSLDAQFRKIKQIKAMPVATSGGTPEGTAIKSTGISVGLVLQADGDGTSSWASLAGGGNAQTANPLSQFAATTSAQLAGVITNETGTGSLVFSTSPTLVTPNLGTPSTLVGTNITGTAAGLTVGATTGVQAGATANDTDANLVARANHTGTQLLSTISDAGALAALNAVEGVDVDSTGVADGLVLTADGAGNSAWEASATVASLDDVTDVTITANTSGELLKWNGTAWINQTLSEAGIEPADTTILKDADIGVTVAGVPTIRTAVGVSDTSTDADFGNWVELPDGCAPTLHESTNAAKIGQSISYRSAFATAQTILGGDATVQGNPVIGQHETVTATLRQTGVGTTVYWLTGGSEV